MVAGNWRTLRYGYRVQDAVGSALVMCGRLCDYLCFFDAICYGLGERRC